MYNTVDLFSRYKNHIDDAFDVAEKGTSKINQEIKDMQGMTGLKTRHFYNHLMSLDAARYLEIGSWKGSSVCSAMYGNEAKVVCIDNWSEFGGPKQEFLENFMKFKGKNDAMFIENDCFKVETEYLPKFNIYMYDGNHQYDSHYRALVHYIDTLDDVFIFIVDDWNWFDVRKGTQESILRLGLEVLYEREIRLTQDNNHTEEQLARSTWWNGIYVAILKKSSVSQSK